MICPRNCGQSWARRASLMSICPARRCCRLPLPLMRLSPRRISRLARVHCSPAPSALAAEHGGLAPQAALEVEVGVQLELLVLELALAAQRTGQRAGSSATQYAGFSADRSSAVSQAMPSANCRFRWPSALPWPAVEFQLGQEDLLEVATERRDHIELARPGRRGRP